MPLIFHEHAMCEEGDLRILREFLAKNPNYHFKGQPDYVKPPVCLGIDDRCVASYYIGADWIRENELAAIVLPKIKNLDFTEMFLDALLVDSQAETHYFSKCYGIDFDKPEIDAPKELNQLSVLLLVQYIVLLEQLVERGVRKDYVTIEENLKSKIKGHLMVAKHLNKNVIPHREDRAYCRYQFYTEDIPVNRLLKKALLFAQQMLLSISSLASTRGRLQPRLNALLMRFNQISDDASMAEVRCLSANKLYRHYVDAVQVAKDILHRYDYSLSEVAESGRKTPPFWIDMARLFELYTYKKLYAAYGRNIEFQVPGHEGTQADFIHVDDRLIMDTKYKPHYEYSYKGIIDDVREISGYARDTKILHHFGTGLEKLTEELRCLIIYPVTEVEKATLLDANSFPDNLWDSATPIDWFRNFRKISVLLPLMPTSEQSGEDATK